MNIGIIVGLLVGLAIGAQATINSLLGKAIGFWVTAAGVSLATAISATILVLSVPTDSFSALKQAPIKYVILSGILGMTIVGGIAFTISKTGVAVGLFATIVGQLFIALIMDHYGILSTPKSPITLDKILGIGLLLVGLRLLTKS